MSLSFDQMVLAPLLTAFGEGAQGQPLPVYTPAGQLPFALDGWFDRAYREIDQLTGIAVSAGRPVLGVRLSMFPTGIAPAQSDQVRIRSVLYLVREVRPDSHGHALLLLSLA
jgi:hypothetical protein